MAIETKGTCKCNITTFEFASQGALLTEQVQGGYVAKSSTSQSLLHQQQTIVGLKEALLCPYVMLCGLFFCWIAWQSCSVHAYLDHYFGKPVTGSLTDVLQLAAPLSFDTNTGVTPPPSSTPRTNTLPSPHVLCHHNVTYAVHMHLHKILICHGCSHTKKCRAQCQNMFAPICSGDTGRNS